MPLQITYGWTCPSTIGLTTDGKKHGKKIETKENREVKSTTVLDSHQQQKTKSWSVGEGERGLGVLVDRENGGRQQG